MSLFQLGRKCLHGLATTRIYIDKDEVKYRSKGAKEVNSRLRLPTVEAMLRVQRLTRFQRIAANPERNELWITTFFGTYGVEQEFNRHSHFVQLQYDLYELKKHGCDEALPEQYWNRPLELIKDKEAAESLQHIDMTMVYKTVGFAAIPPPGQCAIKQGEQEVDAGELEDHTKQQWECSLQIWKEPDVH